MKKTEQNPLTNCISNSDNGTTIKIVCGEDEFEVEQGIISGEIRELTHIRMNGQLYECRPVVPDQKMNFSTSVTFINSFKK